MDCISLARRIQNGAHTAASWSQPILAAGSRRLELSCFIWYHGKCHLIWLLGWGRITQTGELNGTGTMWMHRNLAVYAKACSGIISAPSLLPAMLAPHQAAYCTSKGLRTAFHTAPHALSALPGLVHKATLFSFTSLAMTHFCCNA